MERAPLTPRFLAVLFLVLISRASARAETGPAVTIPNWPAPSFWTPDSAESGSDRDGRHSLSATAEAAVSAPLPFVAVTPCRIADTRGNGFTGAYGPPSLPEGAPRDFTLTGQCGIPAAAKAVSLNVTVVNPAGPGFILLYPQGSPQPTVSTLNYVAGQVVANAAVAPLGPTGAITAVAGVSATDLIIDVNGYYGGGLVTTVNGLSGNVSLAAGSNVSITPSGQTLTIDASGGPGGVLPAGTSGQTLRHDGTNWVASDALTNNGTDVSVGGALNLNGAVNFGSFPHVMVSSFSFIHLNSGSNNTFLGLGAGSLLNNGASDTAMGTLALQNLTSGLANTAFGDSALGTVTSGGFNTAVGADSGLHNATANANTSVGYSSLNLTTGGSNTAVGSGAGSSVTSGTGNIVIGVNAGSAISTGSSNILIGSAGFSNESNMIRIGDPANQTAIAIAGIAGATAPGGIAVLTSGGGRLGTTTSSRRFKEDIRGIGTESDRLMQLRPVVFRYKPEIDPTGLTQYGLIAEEVADVYPDLVAYGEDGQPYAIRYHLLDALFLNEIQRQRRTLDSQAEDLACQKETNGKQSEVIEELRARLAAIEALLTQRAAAGPGR